MKYIKWFLILISLILSVLVFYVYFLLPNVGEAEYITIDKTKERVVRGEYLANNVSVCMDCHSTRDWNKYSGPLVNGTLGKGGEIFDQKLGLPGVFYAKNITPYGIGNWTDGELLRAISSGVNKDNKALFPIMPHPNFGKMDKEDLLSIITYLRSIPSIESSIPASKPDFPMNFIINTIPKKATYTVKPSENDPIKYGAYLFNAASCNECHTKQEKGEKVKGMELAGGFEFPLITGGISRSANITPDDETGIGKWTEKMFVNQFKMYTKSTFVLSSVTKGSYNTVMPWTMYSKMKENDLKAIYAYLRTVKPIKNSVIKFSK